MMCNPKSLAILLFALALQPACSDEPEDNGGDAVDVREVEEDVSEADTDLDDVEEVIDPVLADPPTNEELGEDGDAHKCLSGESVEDLAIWCYQGRYTYKCDGEQPVQWSKCPESAQLCSSALTGCVEGSEVPDCPPEGFHRLCSGETSDGRGAIAFCSDGVATGAASCRRDVPICVQSDASNASCQAR